MEGWEFSGNLEGEEKGELVEQRQESSGSWVEGLAPSRDRSEQDAN